MNLQQTTCQRLSGIGREGVFRWYSLARKAIALFQFENTPSLGGEERIVELDEALV
jgi:hypothetical protein